MPEFQKEINSQREVHKDNSGKRPRGQPYPFLPKFWLWDRRKAAKRVQPDQAWLTANPSSGNGNGEITLSAEANPDAAIRGAIVTVSAEGIVSQTVTITQVAALPSGNAEAAHKKIVVYPNPVRDVLYISGAAGCEIILYDIHGLVIFTHRLTNDQETVDLSTLPFGNYVIQIGNKTLKIVK